MSSVEKGRSNDQNVLVLELDSVAYVSPALAKPS